MEKPNTSNSEEGCLYKVFVTETPSFLIGNISDWELIRY